MNTNTKAVVFQLIKNLFSYHLSGESQMNGDIIKINTVQNVNDPKRCGVTLRQSAKHGLSLVLSIINAA